MERVVGYFFGTILWGIVWAYATRAVSRNKGYDDNAFLWGFFFGIIAFIVYLAKPEVPKPKESIIVKKESTIVNDYKPGHWKCRCGRSNPSYMTDCVCGRSKIAIERPKTEVTKTETEKSNKQTTERENVDLLMSYKKLLDAGAITEEEFQAKKAQLFR